MHNLCLDIHRNISIHRYNGCRHEIEIQIFKTYDLIGRKHRLDATVHLDLQYNTFPWSAHLATNTLCQAFLSDRTASKLPMKSLYTRNGSTKTRVLLYRRTVIV